MHSPPSLFPYPLPSRLRSSNMPTLTIGVLALQGGFEEHINHLRKAAAIAYPPPNAPYDFNIIQVRTPSQLAACTALILPGGESTTISLVAAESGLLEPLRDFVKSVSPPTTPPLLKKEKKKERKEKKKKESSNTSQTKAKPNLGNLRRRHPPRRRSQRLLHQKGRPGPHRRPLRPRPPEPLWPPSRELHRQPRPPLSLIPARRRRRRRR